MTAEFLVIVKNGRFYGGTRLADAVWVLGIERAQHFYTPRRADQVVEAYGGVVKVVRAEYTVL